MRRALWLILFIALPAAADPREGHGEGTEPTWEFLQAWSALRVSLEACPGQPKLPDWDRGNVVLSSHYFGSDHQRLAPVAIAQWGVEIRVHRWRETALYSRCEAVLTAWERFTGRRVAEPLREQSLDACGDVFRARTEDL